MRDAEEAPGPGRTGALLARVRESVRRLEQPVAIIRVARVWPRFRPKPETGAGSLALPLPAVVHADLMADSLDAFRSEADSVPGMAVPLQQSTPSAEKEAGGRSGTNTTLKSIAVVALSATIAAAGVWEFNRRTARSAIGSLTIHTTPAGLEVAVDGRPAGSTPITLALAPGSYAIRVGDGIQRRDLAINVTAGSSILQFLELPRLADTPPVVANGSLSVQTDPAGQTVLVDDEVKGVSPLTIDSLQPGEHRVVVRGAGGSVRRTVAVKAGETVSLVLSPAAPTTPAPGWLSVQSPTRLELRENGKLIGTTDTEQLMLPSGDHDIELANESLGYRSTRQITVVSGKTTSIPVDLPYGSISINALPWAEVWLGGERVGETPIANLSRRVGSYEVVLRHPELGERRETVLVTLRRPARLGVDMHSETGAPSTGKSQ
jgi:PEGA domain